MNNGIRISFKNFNLLKNGKKILNNLDVEFVTGEKYLLAGENGAGKSSLLKCLLGLESKFKGKLFFKNESGEESVTLDELNVSFLPEVMALPEQAIVKNYIDSMKRLLKKENKFNGKIFSQYYQNFNINSFENKTFNELSKGMTKQVVLTIVLSSQFDILILDEPFEGLDINKKVLLTKFISDITNDKIVLVASHDFEFSKEWLTTTVILKDGSIAKTKKTSTIQEINEILEAI